MNIYVEMQTITGWNATEVSNKLKDFVYLRLKFLNDKIQREGGQITVVVSPDVLDIQFADFGSTLTSKLEQCISKQDCFYIRNQLFS